MNVLFVLTLLALFWPAQGSWDTCETCGLRPSDYQNYSSAHAAGGSDGHPGAWPWIVSVQQIREAGVVHICGGTLIHPQWVLTAAHCFVNTHNVLMWRVVAGIMHLAHEGPEVQVRYIKRILGHKGYSNITQANDIALIELDEPFQCSPYVQLACVPDFSLRVQELKTCYVSGWGATMAGSPGMPPVLLESQVHLLNTHACNSSGWYRGAIHPHNLCAGYPQGGIDTCQGDSGGPLVCQDPHANHSWLVGVTSWGRGCARARRPGVYTSTQYFREWIVAQMGMDLAGAATSTESAKTHFLTISNPGEGPQPEPTQRAVSSTCPFHLDKLKGVFAQLQKVLKFLRGGKD
ncbi:acrosin-like [Cuculus canorus]|uniref:acrosin-like n=1 Tax=Cuculus canorus TaxID=55661 RepID=UPI0023AA9F8B|nr:acrosin-like [Cuculus canorus]